MKLSIIKLLPFLVLIFVVLGCTKLGRQAPGKIEEQEKVIETLNKKFDLHDPLYKAATGRDFDCDYQFREGIEDGKITLIARFCESTSVATKEKKLAGLLTPENFSLIKKAGFEQVVLYDRNEQQLIASVVIEENLF